MTDQSTDLTEISVRSDGASWPALLPDAAALAARAAGAALDLACPGLGAAGIGILLTNDAALRELNRAWRGKDAPTNVLSFPATETRAGERPAPPFAEVPLELGDLALAAETCAREAAAQHKRLPDHLAHLVVHGVLHLLGYDHESEAEAQVMEALEVRILDTLGIADPYAAERTGAPAHG